MSDALTPSQRRAATRAQTQEDEWNHPRVLDGLDVLNVLQACADPDCRVCKDREGEVRDGYFA